MWANSFTLFSPPPILFTISRNQQDALCIRILDMLNQLPPKYEVTILSLIFYVVEYKTCFIWVLVFVCIGESWGNLFLISVFAVNH
ncbi:hypothetical protein C664_08753 [Thauera sp. 63]|nr:hypothetical protein C664_08753 [Thauera sp. 63]